MKPLEHLLADLAESLPEGAGGEADGVRIDVATAELALPIESRLGREATLLASAPRGRQVTGFDAPLGQMRVSFTREAP